MMIKWILEYLRVGTVRHITGRDNDDTYLLRITVFATRWVGVYLHVFYRGDEDEHLHDHPWSFISILLSGSYTEEQPGVRKIRKAGSIMFRRATALHRVEVNNDGPLPVSLFIRFRRHRRWGFATREGWIESTEYLERLKR